MKDVLAVSCSIEYRIEDHNEHEKGRDGPIPIRVDTLLIICLKPGPYRNKITCVFHSITQLSCTPAHLMHFRHTHPHFHT